MGGAVVRGLPGPDVRAFSFGFGLDRLGSHRPGRLPRKKTKKTKQKKNKNKIIFLKISHLALSDSLMFPGADSYSNEKRIITTARACSTACVIIGGV